jgi:hypothetical protein
MSIHAQSPGALFSRAVNVCNVQNALMRGRKGVDEVKSKYQAQTCERLISVGRYVEGVSQDFVLDFKKPVSYWS